MDRFFPYFFLFALSQYPFNALHKKKKKVSGIFPSLIKKQKKYKLSNFYNMQWDRAFVMFAFGLHMWQCWHLHIDGYLATMLVRSVIQPPFVVL